MCVCVWLIKFIHSIEKEKQELRTKKLKSIEKKIGRKFVFSILKLYDCFKCICVCVCVSVCFQNTHVELLLLLLLFIFFLLFSQSQSGSSNNNNFLKCLYLAHTHKHFELMTNLYSFLLSIIIQCSKKENVFGKVKRKSSNRNLSCSFYLSIYPSIQY